MSDAMGVWMKTALGVGVFGKTLGKILPVELLKLCFDQHERMKTMYQALYRVRFL
jgi:hypothetical protein